MIENSWKTIAGAACRIQRLSKNWRVVYVDGFVVMEFKNGETAAKIWPIVEKFVKGV